MKKIFVFVTLMFLFTGCTECTKKVVKVYVDTNGTESTHNKKFKSITIDEFACDKDGYAYTIQRVSDSSFPVREIYIPFLRNHTYGAYQMKCKDLY